MPIEEKKKICMQNIFLENRNKLNVTGVLDVLNFDEQIITVETELGVFVVKGSDLRLNKYNLDINTKWIGTSEEFLSIVEK